MATKVTFFVATVAFITKGKLLVVTFFRLPPICVTKNKIFILVENKNLAQNFLQQLRNSNLKMTFYDTILRKLFFPEFDDEIS